MKKLKSIDAYWQLFETGRPRGFKDLSEKDRQFVLDSFYAGAICVIEMLRTKQGRAMVSNLEILQEITADVNSLAHARAMEAMLGIPNGEMVTEILEERRKRGLNIEQ
jgi:hypothetical protein